MAEVCNNKRPGEMQMQIVGLSTGAMCVHFNRIFLGDYKVCFRMLCLFEFISVPTFKVCAVECRS